MRLSTSMVLIFCSFLIVLTISSGNLKMKKSSYFQFLGIKHNIETGSDLKQIRYPSHSNMLTTTKMPNSGKSINIQYLKMHALIKQPKFDKIQYRGKSTTLLVL